MSGDHVTHGDIMVKLRAIDARLAEGDARFASIDKRLGTIDTAMSPMARVVERFGGEVAFSDAAKEAAEGLTTLRTFGRWTRRIAALVVAIGVIMGGIKFMGWDMWRV